MNGISVKKRSKSVSRKKQGRIQVLIRVFGKLDESKKDYIRKLTRKLAEIHCSEGGFANSEISGVNLGSRKIFQGDDL